MNRHVNSVVLQRCFAVAVLVFVPVLRASAACQAQTFSPILRCDVSTEAEFREAVAATGFAETWLVLHNNFSLASPVDVAGHVVLDLNAFNVSGTFRGTGRIHLSCGWNGTALPDCASSMTTIRAEGSLEISATRTYLDGATGVLRDLSIDGKHFRTGGDLLIADRVLLTPGYDPVFSPWDFVFDTTRGTTTIDGTVFVRGGRLVKSGSGTLVLSGDNTDPSALRLGILVKGGTLQVSRDASLGAQDRRFDFCYLSQCSTFYTTAQPLGLDGGALRAGASFALERSIVLGAAGGTIDTNGFTLLTRKIEGVGGLTKTGLGTLTIGERSNFAGALWVRRGTLQVGIDEALPSATAVTIDSGASLESGGRSFSVGSLSGAGTVVLSGGTLAVGAAGASSTFAGSVVGSGRLTKLGNGALWLTGQNHYSGGTTVSAGALIGTTTSLQGHVQDDATIGFDQDADGTFVGTMVGTGRMFKAGAGTVTFTDPQTYSGETRVMRGRLNINGLSGSVTIDRSATLGASGAIAGSVAADGTLALNQQPTTIGGDLVLNETSTLSLPARSTEVLAVTGRTTIGGARLAIAGDGRSRVTVIPLLTSQAGVTGRFGEISAGPSVDAVAITRARSAYAVLQRTDIPLASLAVTPNTRAVADTLDRLRTTTSGDLRQVIREVGALPDSEIDGALTQLGGTVVPSALEQAKSGSLESLRGIANRFVDQASIGARDAFASAAARSLRGRFGLWFRAGRGGAVPSDTDRARAYEGVLGGDIQIGSWRIGTFAGADHQAFDSGDRARIRDRSIRAGGYLHRIFGRRYVMAVAAGGTHQFETDRNLSFAATLDARLGGGPIFDGILRVSSARFAGTDLTGSLEYGETFHGRRGAVQPFAGLDGSRVRSDGFAESGAGAASLATRGAALSSVPLAVGLRAWPRLSGFRPFVPRVELRYARDLTGRTVLADSAFVGHPEERFTLASVHTGQNVLTTAAAVVLPAGRTSLSLEYRARWSADPWRRHTVAVGVAF